MTLKDNTRQRLYRAETAWRETDVPEAGKLTTFDNEKQAQKYLAKVIGDIVGDLGDLTVEFADKDPKRPKDEIGMFRPADNTILLRPGGRTNAVLAHEVVHWQCKSVFAPSHGGEFARAWLDLAEQVFGDDLGRQLKDRFDDQKVIWTLRDQRAAAWKQVYRLESDWDNHVKDGSPWAATLVVTGDEGENVAFNGSFRRVGKTGVAAFERDAKYRKVKKARTFDREDLLYLQAPMYRDR